MDHKKIVENAVQIACASMVAPAAEAAGALQEALQRAAAAQTVRDYTRALRYVHARREDLERELGVLITSYDEAEFAKK